MGKKKPKRILKTRRVKFRPWPNCHPSVTETVGTVVALNERGLLLVNWDRHPTYGQLPARWFNPTSLINV